MMGQKQDRDLDAASERFLASALGATRPAVVTAIIFGLFINIFGLAGPIYMLQIYDRVLASRNAATLVVLTLIVAFIYATSAVLEALRTKLLVRAGILFDRLIHPHVFRAVQRATVLDPGPAHVQCLRDVNTIREFYTGAGLIAFCDIPWVPVYAIAASLLHPLYGLLAAGAGVVSVLMAAANEWLTRTPLTEASRNARAAASHAAATFRNAEVLQAMGMAESLRLRWAARHEEALSWQSLASDRSGTLLAGTRFVRALLQSLILAMGAWLVIGHEVTPGMMIAASIIIGKALSPVEVAISQWRQYKAMREARRRLDALLDQANTGPPRLDLPAPAGHLSLENVSARAPGQKINILRNVSLVVPAGTVLGVVGPSAAGKSSLLRVLTGLWPVAGGAVRLDGSDLRHWNNSDLGRHIGYLPQDTELFPGTIAENIARFDENAPAQAIISAAEIAGVHGMIQQMPEGYDTQIGEGGQALSGGQRQRIGLARALFGMPRLVVLDEPDASLDSAGEAALLQAIITLARAGRSVIVVTHKQSLLSAADMIAVMNAGRIQACGPRDQIIEALGGVRPPGLPESAPVRLRAASAA